MAQRIKFRGETYTRKGGMQEMSATLRKAKREINAVMQEFPSEAHGSAWLEQAIELIGRVEHELTITAGEVAS